MTAVWKRSVLLIGLFGLVTALYAAINMVFDGMPFEHYIRGVASFACFGFLLGGIFSFDSESELKVENRPILRALVGCISGISVGLLWHWPVEGIVVSGMVASLLGLLGMVWAKYAQF
ncbi:MAG: hypothetical protein ACXWJK_15030 [Burkholderiaceae bacterium]